jgi:hypothetical protein
MYLACFSGSSNDKLEFNVGLQEGSEEGEYVNSHPSTNQRSEDEKVQAGDDVILVIVATERYWYMTNVSEDALIGGRLGYILIASFH